MYPKLTCLIINVQVQEHSPQHSCHRLANTLHLLHRNRKGDDIYLLPRATLFLKESSPVFMCTTKSCIAVCLWFRNHQVPSIMLWFCHTEQLFPICSLKLWRAIYWPTGEHCIFSFLSKLKWEKHRTGVITSGKLIWEDKTNLPLLRSICFSTLNASLNFKLQSTDVREPK